MADLLGILRIKDSNGNWMSVPGLKGDTGEPFKILGIYATAAALEAAVTDPEVSDVYLVGTSGAYDIYLYLADGWHNTGRYMPKGDQGDPASQAAITSAVETWLAANVDPDTGYVIDTSLSLAGAAADAKKTGDTLISQYKSIEAAFDRQTITHEQQTTSAGSQFYYLGFKLPKGAICIFENTSNIQYTLNVGNGTDETNIGTISAGDTFRFELQHDIDRIRSYCPASSTWKFSFTFGGIQDIIEDSLNTQDTITWNQLAKPAQEWSRTWSPDTVTTDYDEITATNPANGSYAFMGSNATPIENHKYLFICYAKAINATASLLFQVSDTPLFAYTSSNEYEILSLINTAVSGKTFNYNATLRCASASDNSSISFKHPKIIDLTLLGLEDITPEEFISVFPNWAEEFPDTTGTQRYLTKTEKASLDSIDRDNKLSLKISSVTDNLLNTSFNSTYHVNGTDYEAPCMEFSELMSGDIVNNIDAVSKCESFLFFTDPHTQNSIRKAYFEEYMGQIQKVYHTAPCYFVLCGGDWLGNSDTPAEASYKLGLIGATCRSMFDKCYMLVGNHDTNYQGKRDSSSSDSTRLPNESISNFWYGGKPAYFTFDGMNTKFYCFDTGVEGQALSDLDNYGYKEAMWFANALLSDNSEHIAMAMHIYYQAGTTMSPLSEQFMQIASAYNNRASITVNETTYNYASATGRIEFVIAGHTHADTTTTYTSGDSIIPVIITRDVGSAQTFPDAATFDLVFVDYDNRKVKCVRVGSGNNREVNLSTLY